MSGTSHSPKDLNLQCPPKDGSLNHAEVLEFNAKHNPDAPFWMFARDAEVDDLVTISHREFRDACHRVAHILRPRRAGPERQVVGIIANSDSILYQTYVMSMIVAGMVPFPISQRNSAPAVVSMITKVSCHHILATPDVASTLIHDVKRELEASDYAVHVIDPPELALVFPQVVSKDASVPPVEEYPAVGQRPSLSEVMVYLHSSGSTGFPKPIPQTYQTSLDWTHLPCIHDVPSYPTFLRVGGMSLPSFHTLGLETQLYMPMFALRPVVHFRPSALDSYTALPVVPNADNLIEYIKKTKVNTVTVVPSFVEQWASNPRHIEVLKGLEFVVFSGGPLSLKCGNQLTAAGVCLTSLYGATEFAAAACCVPDPHTHVCEDWAWTRLPDIMKTRWISQGDGTYELHILTSDTFRPSVENLPDVRGYATSDVFAKHPTKEGFWRIVGRADDVIILSTGEKTVPLPMEGAILANPAVGGVVLFGRERTQIGALVEPRPGYEVDVNDPAQIAKFRNLIWPDVEEANKDAPAFSRIFKEMILVVSTDKPMLRAGKGTVNKKATVKYYEPEINELYETVLASASAGADVPLPESWTPGAVETWLQTHIEHVNSGKKAAPEVDLFAQGFDSLSATFLRNRIIGSLKHASDPELREHANKVSQNVVFANPTVRQLAQAVCAIVRGDVSEAAVDVTYHVDAIEAMVAKYSAGLPGSVGNVGLNGHAGVNGKDHGGSTVLLTGSTGALGSELLVELLGRDDVRTVYAFNRSSGRGEPLHERQSASFEQRGFDTELLKSDKLVFVEGDTTQDKLGLSDDLYEKIRSSATHIIHNAWRVDFNLALSSFESQVRGARNLINLAHTAKFSGQSRVRFMFASSISAAQAWPWDPREGAGSVPEDVIADGRWAVGNGYGEGKYVTERILAQSGLPATSFRIGQMSGGPPRGAWSTTEWFPIIVQSSVSMGLLPDAAGVASWLPMEAVARAMLDVAFAPVEPPSVLNLVHPRATRWSDLIAPINGALARTVTGEKELPVVPFAEWFAELERRSQSKDAGDEAEIRRLPALKLLDFMRNLARADTTLRSLAPSSNVDSANVGGADVDVESVGFQPFATTKAQQASKTMRTLAPLTAREAARWVEYWNSVGMFSEV
ncbi:acetyl-CoA synthetase-like protein [Coniophora puteana RWD-64-598 SS2]|uniref:Acetyl-CoA synthetase-like protein n=1 Tax=Coniophora puteana (strain RWD-64-598) TaxID=741705 RepID=A0A5M3MD19_CONPW|nr:acetyl-CoA synthetase-like protein [Coniophora puteana RWD-64-598 SS2]EIW76897.1 acetyl-CoA synthetase-like protein [Coniophora puteana RWD-64-598 SS2]